MKEAVKKSRVLVSALVLTMVVAMLSACGSSDSNALLTTWSIDYAVASGVTMSAEALEEQGLTMSFEFKDDGTVTGTVSGVSVDGTYTQDGTTVSITFEEDTEDLKFEDNVLTWEYEGMTIYFKK